MGNSEENKKKCNCNIGVIFLILIFAVVLFLIGSFISLFFEINPEGFQAAKQSNTESNVLANLGTIGDYFGGMINPLLAFASFCGLLYTIHIQRKELGMTKEELARSADAQEKSSAIFKQQQFEATFFSLLNQIILSIDNFHKSYIKRDIRKKGLFDHDRNSFKSEEVAVHEIVQLISSNKTLSEAWRKINLYDSSLPKIFILIYQLLKLIDEYESVLVKSNDNDAYRKAKNYSNILRACLDVDFLHLFAINGCRTDFNNMPIYKGYIEKYALLEHMTFKFRNELIGSKILDEMLHVYSKEAFGNNSIYKRLMEHKKELEENSKILGKTL